MPPPLISDYKKYFVLKRLTQTFLGGPRLISPPIYIVIQVIIFTIPAIIVSLVNLDKKELSLKWKAIATGCSVFLVDLCMCLVILLLKKVKTSVNPIGDDEVVQNQGVDGENLEERRNNNADSNVELRNDEVQDSQFLAEEDAVVSEGCLKPSTWQFIAPNVTLGIGYIVGLTLSSVSFGLCTPLMILETIPPILRGFAIFAVCIARYSSVLSSPPEVATFDAIDRKHLLYRTFYTSLVGGFYIFIAQIMENASPENGHLLLVMFSSILACLPILWALGILPPLDALFPWVLETVLSLAGGSSPSYFYAGTFVSLVIVILCPIIVFVLSRDSLLIILVECLCGYITACDTGRIISVKSTLCEEIPIKSLLRQLLQPTIIIFTSLLCVFTTWLNLSQASSFEYQLSFAIITLIITILSWILRHFTIARKISPPKLLIFPISVLHGLLTFLLHIWLTLSIEHEDNEWSSINTRTSINIDGSTNTTEYIYSTNHSLERLVPYMLTIRAYAVSISDPGKSSVDFTSAFVYKEYLAESEKASFVLVLFIVSLITKGFGRFLKHLKTICSIVYAFGVSVILNSKLRLSVTSFVLVPVSLFSLIIATIMEGTTLTPIFTLPIFLLGFPRPSSFWNERWFPKSKDKRKGTVPHVETVDWKIYSEIGPLMACGICRKAYKAKLKLQRGDCYLARYEDRLLFVRVLASGWNYVYLQIKGLEMQEQTSCHHQEAANVDERLENTLGTLNDSVIKSCINPFSINILKPILRLTLPTYSESKSNISPLNNAEDKATYRDMFYRSFSYLWIKNNPALKGESYQRALKMKEPKNFSSSLNRNNGEGMAAINNIDNFQSNSNEFSLNNALFKCTVSTVNFIKADSTPGSVPESGPSSNTTGSGNQNLAFEGDEPQEPKVLSRQSTRSNLVSPTDNNRMLGPSVLLSLVGLDGDSSTSERLSSIWIKQCVGDVIPPNAVKARVEKLCRGIWNTIMGLDNEREIDLSQFFQDDFLFRLKTVSTSRKIDMEDITLKAFRYASKLALDEIYSSASYASSSKVITLDAESEEEVFNQLTLFERDYQFCSPDEIPSRIEQNTNRILTIVKKTNTHQNVNESGQLSTALTPGNGNNANSSVMRMLNYETEGVEFRVGELNQSAVEGIWANLNLELLYFTSDDDERFSIQHDKILLRNIITQCAKSPLGYPVYDSVFRVNLFDFSVSQVE